MIAEPKNIPLKGLFKLPIELDSVSVQHRAKFWKILGEQALGLKQKEILSGIDRWGQSLKPVKRKWGDPTPLLPHGKQSRTYRLLSVNVTAQGATLYWRQGFRVPWPRILGYHAYQHGKRALPVRNVLGLAPLSVEKLVQQTEMWKAGYEAGLEAAKSAKAVVTPAPKQPATKETRLERILREKRERAAKGISYSPERATPSSSKATPSSAKVAPRVTPAHPVASKIESYEAGKEKHRKVLEIGSDAIKARTERDLAADRILSITASLKGTTGAERKRLKIELDAAQREHEVADLQFSKLNREARQKVLNTIRIEEKAQRIGIEFRTDETNPLSKNVMEAVGGALNFFGRLVSNIGISPVKVAVAPIPPDEPQRAHHLGGKHGLIRLGSMDKPSVIIHELGHLLEAQIPSWGDAAREFLAYRTKGEESRPFREVIGKQYGENEKGKKDKFDEVFGTDGWYVGKEYGHGATEITSMGIEKLFEDPVTFASKDPEFFKWLLGMLDGGLRK